MHIYAVVRFDIYVCFFFLSKAQLVGFLVVEPIHPGLSSRHDTGARIFLDLFQDLTTLFFQW
jgi:hypothetical protein